MLIRVFGAAAVAVLSFCAVLPFTLPLDLIADRWVFPRLESEWGVSAAAMEVEYSFPRAIVLTRLSMSVDGGKSVVSQSFDRVTLRPDWSALWGNRSGEVEAFFADGKMSGRMRDEVVDIALGDVKIQQLGFLSDITNWKVRGTAGVSGTIRIKGAGGRPEADLALTFENIRADEVAVLGIVFPEVRIAGMNGAINYREGRLEIQDLKSSGGNAALDIAGSVTLLAPLGRSVISVLAKVGLGPELVSSMIGGKEMIPLVTKPDGTVHLAMYGNLAEPAYSFR